MIIATVQSQQDNPSLNGSDNADTSNNGGERGGSNGSGELNGTSGNLPFDNFSHKSGDSNDFEKFKVTIGHCFAVSLIKIILRVYVCPDGK